METFCPAKAFVEYPDFEAARSSASASLELEEIDRPIVSLISEFAELPFCFMLQSCYGHFQCKPDDAWDTLDPIPDNHEGEVRYRIAYIALCIENSDRGRAFHDQLASVPSIDRDYLQFGSANWFWDQWINSYVLQVEPAAFQFQDAALLDVKEARQVEQIRDQFFIELAKLVSRSTGNREF